MVISHPKMAMDPTAARFAGSMKTPEPIMLPATIRVAGTRPILAESATPAEMVLEALSTAAMFVAPEAGSTGQDIDAVETVLDLDPVRVMGEAREPQVIGLKRLEVTEDRTIG